MPDSSCGCDKISLMRVSYTGNTSAFQADERGPTPLTRSIKRSPPLWGISFWKKMSAPKVFGTSSSNVAYWSRDWRRGALRGELASETEGSDSPIFSSPLSLLRTNLYRIMEVNKQSILETAMRIRKSFEDGSVYTSQLGRDYLEYNPSLEDIDSFLSEAKKMFPKLNCGLATVVLRREIGFGEIVNGYYGQEKHTFLQMSPTEIVCITSDQYGGPPVYVGEIKPPWKRG